MKLLTSYLILLGIPVLLSLTTYFVGPWLFRHGSSAAFNLGCALWLMTSAAWVLPCYLLWSCRK